MKINLRYYDMTLHKCSTGVNLSSSGHCAQEIKNPQNFRERNRAVLYKEKSDDTGYKEAAYSGSFTEKSETAAPAFTGGMSLWHKILKSDRYANWMDKCIFDHNIASSAFMALILAGILRPATVLSLPGKKDKEDKIYSAGHAIASGIIGFAASVILTSPLDAAVKKLFGAEEILDKDGNITKVIKGYDKYGSKRLKEIAEKTKQLADSEKTVETIKQTRLLKNSKNALKQISKNIPDWIIGFPRSMLTIALIPPILKYVFGVEKKKAPEAQPAMIVTSIANKAANMKSFEEFRGGLK